MMEMCESAFGISAVATVVSAWNLQDNTAASLSYSYSAITPVSWNEANGPLDSLNISWSSTSIPCIIWGMAVTRYQ
jgi:hypothetical protein